MQSTQNQNEKTKEKTEPKNTSSKEEKQVKVSPIITIVEDNKESKNLNLEKLEKNVSRLN